MARYELTGPDGSRYEVTAPDTMDEQAVLGRFKSELGDNRRPVKSAPSAPADGPYQQEINAEAQRRQRRTSIADSPVDLTQATIGDTVTLGAFPQIMAGGRVAFGRMLGTRPGRMDFSEDYRRERDTIRQEIELRRREAGTGRTLPLDLLGGITAVPARTAAAVAEALTMAQRMWQSGKWGAGLGAVTGFNRETGDWSDKARSGLESGIGGAAFGLALPPVLAGAGRAISGIRDAAMYPFRGGNRAASQREIAQDWRIQMPGSEPPGAIVTESPTLQRTTRSLAGNIVGGPVRDDLRRGAADLERGIANEIRGPGLPDETEFAREQQEFLRRQLRGYSRPPADIENMDRTGLELAQRNRADTYPTQYSARYRHAETAPIDQHTTAEQIRGNFVDRYPAGRPRTSAMRPTSTWDVLNTFGQEARASGNLPGWKNGDFTGAAFWRLMDSRVGQEVSALLRSEYGRRLGRQANITIPGLRDQRTQVGKAIGDIRNRSYESRMDAPPGDLPSLQRLYGAMTDDIPRFLRESGPGGNAAADLFRSADRSYHDDFMQGLREPLARIVGSKVPPDQALRRLMQATQRNSYDSSLLSAWRRVLLDKASPEQLQTASRMMLTPMLEDGLPGFLRAWEGMHPGARRILATGDKKLFDNLDKYARLARRLEPYQRALHGDRGFDLANASNIALASTFLHGFPAMLTAAGGAHLLARFMSSPKYVSWLTKAPLYTSGGPGSPAFRAYLNQLHAISGRDDEIGQAVMQGVGEMLRPGNAQALFLSENSATADKEALARAKEMKQQGADTEAIREQTGWFWHGGQWSYEIDDRQFRQTKELPERRGTHRYFDYFSHPELERALPTLKDKLQLRVRPGEDAFFEMSTDPNQRGGRRITWGQDRADTPEEQLGTALHELQHAVDNEGGWVQRNPRTGEGPYLARPEEQRAFDAEERREYPPELRRERRPLDPAYWDKQAKRTIEVEYPTPRVTPRLQGPRNEQQPSKSARPRDVERDEFVNRGLLERFTEPARGIAGTVTRMAQEVPESFNRLLNYRTGQDDPQAPLDAMTLGSLVTGGGLSSTAPRGALTMGIARPAALRDMGPIIARLRKGESYNAIADELGVSAGTMSGIVAREHPQVAAELAARTDKPRLRRRVGKHEQMVQFAEMMEQGASVDEIVRKTLMPRKRVQALIEERYGSRAMLDDAAPSPPPPNARPQVAVPDVREMVRAGRDHKEIARALRISPEAALREMQTVRRTQLAVRGMPFPVEQPADFWDHDAPGALVTGEFGTYWGDDKVDAYDEGIVGDRRELPNPEGGRMRHYDPMEVLGNVVLGRRVPARGRFGITDQEPDRNTAEQARTRGFAPRRPLVMPKRAKKQDRLQPRDHETGRFVNERN